MKYFFSGFLILIALCGSLCARIRFLTFHCNRPDFIEMQYRTFKKFIQNDYELIIFNDARSEEGAYEINEMCQKLNLKCIRYEQQWHSDNPLNSDALHKITLPGVHDHLGLMADLSAISAQASLRHCHVIQYALDHFGYGHSDIVVIIDGDFFPIRPTNIRALMHRYQIIGMYKWLDQEKIGYLAVPFIAMQMPSLPNKEDLKFRTDLIGDFYHDSGAHSYHYMKNNPNILVRKFSWDGSTSHTHDSESYMLSIGFNEQEIALAKNLPWPYCVEFHVDHHFLHYCNGHASRLEDIKSQHVIAFLNGILQ